jgi:hypothetical protein
MCASVSAWALHARVKPLAHTSSTRTVHDKLVGGSCVQGLHHTAWMTLGPTRNARAVVLTGVVGDVVAVCLRKTVERSADCSFWFSQEA